MNIGGPELLIVFCIFLIVFGPKRFPEIARFISRATREMRKAIDEIKREIGGKDRFEG